MAEWLGQPYASLQFMQGDTDQVAFGRGTYAARSSMIASGALRMAADSIIEKARPIAAHLLEAAEAGGLMRACPIGEHEAAGFENWNEPADTGPRPA